MFCINKPLFYSGTKRFKKPLGVDQDSSLDSQSDFSVLDMEILGDHIYYIHDGMFSDQIRNDDTSADLLYSAVYGGTGFTDMVFLHHSLQPGRFDESVPLIYQLTVCMCLHSAVYHLLRCP